MVPWSPKEGLEQEFDRHAKYYTDRAGIYRRKVNPRKSGMIQGDYRPSCPKALGICSKTSLLDEASSIERALNLGNIVRPNVLVAMRTPKVLSWAQSDELPGSIVCHVHKNHTKDGSCQLLDGTEDKDGKAVQKDYDEQMPSEALREYGCAFDPNTLSDKHV